MIARLAYFETYRGGIIRRSWRWRLRAANGKIIATGGGDGFKNYGDCTDSIALVKSMADAPVIGEKPA